MPAPIKHTFDAAPLVPDQRPKPKGRPKAPEMPALPRFDLSDYEQSLYDYFILVFTEADMTPADHLLLLLAGIEFIKYLRVAGQELSSGEVISQARQHPGTQLNALLDRLSVTRKAREKKPKEETDENADLLSRLSRRAG